MAKINKHIQHNYIHHRLYIDECIIIKCYVSVYEYNKCEHIYMNVLY